MRKPEAAAKHKVEMRTSPDGAINELLIWHGPQVIFHLKRMAPDFIWFATYIDESADIEIKIDGDQITMIGKDTPAPRRPGKQSRPAAAPAEERVINAAELKPGESAT